MPAYIIIKVSIDDPSLLKDYQAATPAIIEKYKGKFIVRGGATETLEGPEESRRTVILKFPELADAKAYYHSPEYSAARKLREGVGHFEVTIIDGI
jgi:uncharacterized protein (DUF1330 family)